MELLKDLAISETGFVFNPNTGESFKVNELGLLVLKLFKQGKTLAEISEQVTSEYEVSLRQAEKDITDFFNMLKIYNLLNG